MPDTLMVRPHMPRSEVASLASSVPPRHTALAPRSSARFLNYPDFTTCLMALEIRADVSLGMPFGL